MPSRLLHPDDYELVNRHSSESDDIFNLDDADFETQGLTSISYNHNRPLHFLRSFILSIPFRIRAIFDRRRFRQRRTKKSASRCLSLLRPLARRVCFLFNAILSILSVIILLTAIFKPSYTQLPTHYQLLKTQILESSKDGRGNIDKQKIFIAASIYDSSGRLATGAWGDAVLNLIDILGNENVFLSIYENDGGVKAQTALKELESKLQCSHNLNFEAHLSLENIPHITLLDGSKRIKRIAYLAEVRNRALLPLDEAPSTKYDKILFLNDVIFNPIDATQLLFSTHADEHGKTDYLAACAVDFINPFKFYDTFATRDLEGYSMGVPFFPWYSSAGKGLSRQDVLDGKDAVRVKSCWGGMVAFDAEFFQNSNSSQESGPAAQKSFSGAALDKSSRPSRPIRFRAEPDLFWDASECCLIHADLQNADTVHVVDDDFGIYQNPFVRVAYDSRSLWWLGYTRRFERLYNLPHVMVNYVVGLPWFNPRRTEQQGKEVTEEVWIADAQSKSGGSFQEIGRIATAGGYCGMRTLQVLKESSQKGEKNWETIPLPPG